MTINPMATNHLIKSGIISTRTPKTIMITPINKPDTFTAQPPVILLIDYTVNLKEISIEGKTGIADDNPRWQHSPGLKETVPGA
jgi:hypothetical protein